MRIGVTREIRADAHRVALTPVSRFSRDAHPVVTVKKLVPEEGRPALREEQVRLTDLPSPWARRPNHPWRAPVCAGVHPAYIRGGARRHEQVRPRG